MGTRVWGEGQVGTRVCGGEGQVSTRVFQLPGLHRLLPLCLPLPYCSYQARTAFLPFCLPLPCCSYQDRTASLPVCLPLPCCSYQTRTASLPLCLPLPCCGYQARTASLPLCLPLPCCSYQARTASLPLCLPLPCCSYQARTASLPSSPAAGTGSGSGDGSEGENVCLRTLCMFKHMNMHERIVYSPRVPATRDLDLACPMPLLSVSPRVHPKNLDQRVPSPPLRAFSRPAADGTRSRWGILEPVCFHVATTASACVHAVTPMLHA